MGQSSSSWVLDAHPSASSDGLAPFHSSTFAQNSNTCRRFCKLVFAVVSAPHPTCGARYVRQSDPFIPDAADGAALRSNLSARGNSGGVDVSADVYVGVRGRQPDGLDPAPAMHISGGD